MDQSGTAHTGGGAGAGKVRIHDMTLTKYVDKSTPNLIRACCNGEHFNFAILLVRKAGKDPIDYFKVTMAPVMVTSVDTGGSSSDDRIVENVMLNFARMKVEYTPQKQDGTPDAILELIWNIEKNIEE